MFFEFPVSKIYEILGADDLLPAILFRTSRKQCDDDVVKLAGFEKFALPQREQGEIGLAIKGVLERYAIDPGILYEHPQYEVLLRHGVGAHHAGQLLHWRLLLEELMSMGKLRMMIATGTVAAGVDFPARTVVISSHSKRGSEGFRSITSSEFQQMSGRAGRRGKDSIGICLIAPGRFSDARVFHEVADSPPEPLRSSYFASPSSVLNLLKFRNVDDLRYTVERSLAAFHDRKSALGIREEATASEKKLQEEAGTLPEDQARRLAKKVKRLLRDAEKLEIRQESQLQLALDGIQALGHLDERGLTEKGLWAAELCTSLVLHLAEAIAIDLFSNLSLYELVALVASISGDSHRAYFSLMKNPIDEEKFARLEECVERVNELYHGPNTATETTVVPEAALTVLAWLDSEDWPGYAGLLRLSGVAEGDAARVITQTADHLHQISRLNETHPELARDALAARSRLLRPPLTESLILAS